MRVTADRIHDDHRLRTSSGTVPHVGEAGGSKPVDPERQADFAKAVEGSQARRQQGGSLRERIERLAQPTAGDPSLYADERSIGLLQHVVDAVLPEVDMQGEVVEMAVQLLNEEIAQRMEWAERRIEAEELER